MLVVRGLGAADAVATNPDQLSVRAAPPVVSPPLFDAAGLLIGGALTATVLVLHGAGYTKAAFTLGAVGALMGGTFAAIRLLTNR